MGASVDVLDFSTCFVLNFVSPATAEVITTSYVRKYSKESTQKKISMADADVEGDDATTLGSGFLRTLKRLQPVELLRRTGREAVRRKVLPRGINTGAI